MVKRGWLASDRHGAEVGICESNSGLMFSIYSQHYIDLPGGRLRINPGYTCFLFLCHIFSL